MCDKLLEYIAIENIRYGMNVFIFSSIIYFLNYIIRHITKNDLLKFADETSHIKNYFYWTIGASLTSIILVYSSVVTTTIQSSIIVSIGWIKIYVDLFEKFNKGGLPEDV